MKLGKTKEVNKWSTYFKPRNIHGQYLQRDSVLDPSAQSLSIV